MANLDITTANGIKALSETLGWVNVKGRGATGGGVTDDTAAIQAAFNAGKSIFFPPGVYLISSTLTLTDGSWYIFSPYGSGAGTINTGTILKWVGGAGGTFLKCTGVRDSTFENLCFTVGNAPHTVTTMIDFDPTGRTQVETNNRFKNITIMQRGGPTIIDNSLSYGMRISRSTSTGNVDSFIFDNLNIWGCDIAAISIEHSQSRVHRFYSCNLVYNARGISTALNSSSGGSFKCYDCQFGSNSVTDIELGGADDTIQIFGGHMESSNRFLVQDTPGPGWIIQVQGMAFAGSTGLNADGYLMKFGSVANNGAQNIILIGNSFYASETDVEAKIAVWQGLYDSQLTLIGNTFNSESPIYFPLSVYEGLINVTALGNIGWRPGWNFVPITVDTIANSVWNRKSPNYLSGKLNTGKVIQTSAIAEPTTGTWKVGTLIWHSDAASGEPLGWYCTTSGTFSAATDNTGDTDGATAVITGMTDTSDFWPGEYVEVSAGFAAGPHEIISKTATTMTLDVNSTSAETNVTVSTPDPVFVAMANLA